MADQDEDLYDEFGNYIGPDLVDSDDDPDDDGSSSSVKHHHDDDGASDVSAEDDRTEQQQQSTLMMIDNDNDTQSLPHQHQQAIVLHEDKEHYESAEAVYGADVNAVLLDEDAMDLSTPIVEPGDKNKTRHTLENVIPATDYIYTDDYLGVQLSNETTRTRRGIAIVGHLHHGKTSLMDLCLEPTLTGSFYQPKQDPKKAGQQQQEQQQQRGSNHRNGGYWGPRAALDASQGGGPRYLDTLQTEQERKMSLVSSPITALFPDTRGKTYCITALDCPGHTQFHDETVAALKVVDGVVLVVDALEGPQLHTHMCIRQAVLEGLPLTLVISKMDRLIVELKLPPNDAYLKLRHTIETVNEIVRDASRGRYPPLAPERGNVAFSSAQHGWLFTLPSFALTLSDHCSTPLGSSLTIPELAKRLWGDCYLDPTSRQFQTSTRDCRSLNGGTLVQRTFVEFVLEPLYKIYSACLGERAPVAEKLLRQVGVLLSKEQLRASARPLLRSALQQYLATATAGWVDMIVQHVPHPAAAAAGKVARCYTGPQSSRVARAMRECDPRGPLVIHCVKNYIANDSSSTSGENNNSSNDGSSFWTLGRVYSGTIRPAETVRVLGEGYSPFEDEEDVAVAVVAAVAIPRGRGRMLVSQVKAGNWVLLQGVDASMTKTATIVGSHSNNDPDEEVHIFAPLKFPQAGGEAIMKLAIEPLNPAELPKMVEGLRRVSKAYPMAKTKVEESGEHIVLGTGELYMDCLMHDLRHVYSDIEVKVADPIVSFRETVLETSSLKCFAETANKRNKLTFIAEPMDEGLAEQLEAGKVNPKWEPKKLGRYFQTKYNWDLLSSRSVWAFGDSPTHGTNLLLDDTLPSEVDKSLLNSCRSSIVQGFQWATREGPLCEEPVRATKIKILDVTLADKPIYRGGGQVIPTARRTVHSSILTATPRLMEPVYRLDIQCNNANIVESISSVLTRRRGHVVQDRPIPGTKFYCVKGFLPVLDSFGFETDLRTFTQGQAMVFSVFDHWAIVPGDPLDRSIYLHPLEPSPPHHLARELLVKTRRRKGLSEDVSVSKFFDEGMKAYLAEQQRQQEFSAPVVEMLQ